MFVVSELGDTITGVAGPDTNVQPGLLVPADPDTPPVNVVVELHTTAFPPALTVQFCARFMPVLNSSQVAVRNAILKTDIDFILWWVVLFIRKQHTYSLLKHAMGKEYRLILLINTIGFHAKIKSWDVCSKNYSIS
jgi:hypothetical protein